MANKPIQHRNGRELVLPLISRAYNFLVERCAHVEAELHEQGLRREDIGKLLSLSPIEKSHSAVNSRARAWNQQEGLEADADSWNSRIGDEVYRAVYDRTSGGFVCFHSPKKDSYEPIPSPEGEGQYRNKMYYTFVANPKSVDFGGLCGDIEKFHAAIPEVIERLKLGGMTPGAVKWNNSIRALLSRKESLVIYLNRGQTVPRTREIVADAIRGFSLPVDEDNLMTGYDFMLSPEKKISYHCLLADLVDRDALEFARNGRRYDEQMQYHQEKLNEYYAMTPGKLLNEWTSLNSNRPEACWFR